MDTGARTRFTVVLLTPHIGADLPTAIGAPELHIAGLVRLGIWDVYKRPLVFCLLRVHEERNSERRFRPRAYAESTWNAVDLKWGPTPAPW
jgi:hypothetical protein